MSQDSDEEMYSEDDEDNDDEDYAFPSETDEETRLRVAEQKRIDAQLIASRAGQQRLNFGGANCHSTNL